MEDAIGQTGQVMGAGSIEYYSPILGYLLELKADLAQRDRNGGFDMGLLVFFNASDIDDERPLPLHDVVHELAQIDKLRGHALGEMLLGELRISGGISGHFFEVGEKSEGHGQQAEIDFPTQASQRNLLLQGDFNM